VIVGSAFEAPAVVAGLEAPVKKCQGPTPETEAALMRAVGDRLAEVTRAAAQTVGATVVDMATLSIGHDACAPAPWVDGVARTEGTPFHPTMAWAEATARAIARAFA
jgi:hypothetical protein